MSRGFDDIRFNFSFLKFCPKVSLRYEKIFKLINDYSNLLSCQSGLWFDLTPTKLELNL